MSDLTLHKRRIVCSSGTDLNVSGTPQASESKALALSDSPPISKEIIGKARLAAARVFAFCDRDIHGISAITGQTSQHPGTIELCGVLVPGQEIDSQFRNALQPLAQLNFSGRWETKTVSDGVVDEVYKYQVSSGDLKTREIPYFHAPYDSTKLKELPGDDPQVKREKAEYRAQYGLGVCERVAATTPDFVFLNHFKVILPPEVVHKFSGKIINGHPSVLPAIKGFIPEHRAGNMYEFPQWSGYTVHFVANELDGGPTIFQQKVPVEPYVEEEARVIGKALYERVREETLRLRIMEAQSVHIGAVLSAVAAGWPTILVSDAEAFKAEGRPGFENSTAYDVSLVDDYNSWEGINTLDFETWRNTVRKPYQRVLFDMGIRHGEGYGEGGRYHTLESLLGIKESAYVPALAPFAVFRFELQGDSQACLERAGKLAASALRTYHFNSTYVPGTQTLYCEAIASVDLEQRLSNQGVNIQLVRHLPVRVRAPRHSSVKIEKASRRALPSPVEE